MQITSVEKEKCLNSWPLKQSQINLRLPLLEQKLHVLIADNLNPMLNRFRPPPLLSELPVILQQQVDEEHLDLVGGEESAGTSVHAMPESKMLRAGCDELVPVFVSDFLALVVESIPIISHCIGIDGLIEHHVA